MTEFKEGCPIYCILLKNDDEIYIQCESNGCIIAFPTKRKALDYWENGYKSAFDRGLCGATGAMIAMIQCQPKVVYFNSQQDMIMVLFDKPPFRKFNVYSYSIQGILCQKDIEQNWKEGTEPNLLEEYNIPSNMRINTHML